MYSFSLHVPWSCDNFYYIHCILWYIYIYIKWCMFSSPLSHLCCFLSIFIHMFLLVYNLSLFHTWCLDESYLSVSVKIACKSTMPWSLFLQSFSRVCVRIDFIVFNKRVKVEWFMTSLICSFVCYGFVTDCQRWRLLGHIWFTCSEHMSIFYVIG